MRKNKEVKSGWAFMRVSTTGQAEKQHGSLEQQRHMIGRCMERQSEISGCQYNIVKWIEEDRSGRAKSLHLRKALPQLEYAIEHGLIDFFVVEKIDRLSRDQVFNLTIVRLAQKNGVELFEHESGLVDLRDKGKRLGFNIKNVMAEEGSLELEEKITKKQREARVNNQKDTSWLPVLGLDKHKTKSCFYVINKEEQKIVVSIFQKFLSLGSVRATAMWCNEMGFKTKVRYTREKIDKNGILVPSLQIGGNPFTDKTLRRLLSCTKLRGFAFFKDSWNQFPKLQDSDGFVRWEYGYFKEEGPVVPTELWDQVQTLLQKNKQSNARAKAEASVYLLSGVLLKANSEGEPEKKLIGASAKGGANLYYEDRPNNEFRIPKDEIEKVVCARVKSFLRDSGILREVIERSCGQRDEKADAIKKRLKAIATEIAGQERGRQNILNDLRSKAVAGDSDLISAAKVLSAASEQFDAELVRLANERARLEQELHVVVDVYREGVIEEQLAQALKDFDQRCDLEKKQIIQAIIPKIVVHKDRLDLHFNFVDLAPGRGRKPGGKKFDLSKIGSGGVILTPYHAGASYGNDLGKSSAKAKRGASFNMFLFCQAGQ